MILRSQVIKHSLNPFWNQMLIFPPVALHGTKEYIKSLPPEVILQVFDRDLLVSETSFSNLRAISSQEFERGGDPECAKDTRETTN